MFDISKLIVGLDKYKQIMALVQKTNVFYDMNFRTLFCGYYKLRQKSKQFYDVYFEYMESCKKKIPTFETALKYLYKKTGEVHYSFCSKLIATLDPSSPILDQYVLRHCGFAIIGSTVKAEERIKYYTDVYYSILSEYEDALNNSSYVKDFIQQFNNYCPEYSDINDVKKIDCMLVTKGTNRAISYLKHLEYFEIIMASIKRNDIKFEDWIRDVRDASATPVTTGLSISIKDNLIDMNPSVLKFLIDCFEKGMTPFEAVIEWA